MTFGQAPLGTTAAGGDNGPVCHYCGGCREIPPASGLHRRARAGDQPRRCRRAARPGDPARAYAEVASIRRAPRNTVAGRGRRSVRGDDVRRAVRRAHHAAHRRAPRTGHPVGVRRPDPPRSDRFRQRSTNPTSTRREGGRLFRRRSPHWTATRGTPRSWPGGGHIQVPSRSRKSVGCTVRAANGGSSRRCRPLNPYRAINGAARSRSVRRYPRQICARRYNAGRLDQVGPGAPSHP